MGCGPFSLYELQVTCNREIHINETWLAFCTGSNIIDVRYVKKLNGTKVPTFYWTFDNLSEYKKVAEDIQAIIKEHGSGSYYVVYDKHHPYKVIDNNLF